jgi:hypothetical protein
VKVKTDCPDIGGFIVFFDEDLTSIGSVTRCGWGVARFTAAVVSGDGRSIFIGGEAGVNFASIGQSIQNLHGTGGGTFLAKLSGEGQIEWLTMLGPTGRVARVWFDRKGNAYPMVESDGQSYVFAVTPTGRAKQIFEMKGVGRVGVRTIDPVDGGIYWGGDRNTNTGREPWRQPYFYKFDQQGNKLWKLWEWSSKGLRDGKTPGQGLVSDSAARSAAIAPNGDILVGGWSDGGNSVFTRQPADLAEAAPKAATGMSPWGMKGANSLSYVMRIDPETFEQKAWTYWIGYIPEGFMGGKGGWPNGANVERIEVLGSNEIAICGGAATGNVPTPNAFFLRPKSYEGKYGGRYVAVLRPDMSNVTFSSYLPGYDEVGITPSRQGLLVFGRSRKDDGRAETRATPPVGARAAQSRFAGDQDAHIILLRSPDSLSKETLP